MSDFFPNGYASYVYGGLITGAGIGLVYLVTGHVAGISSFLTAAQSWWSRRAFFHEPAKLEERTWKGVLVLGLILGVALYTVIQGEIYTTTVQPWRLLLGGLCVGYGTRLSRGCTSGHGICGIAAGSAPSITSTGVFMAVAVGVAAIVSSLGVTP